MFYTYNLCFYYALPISIYDYSIQIFYLSYGINGLALQFPSKIITLIGHGLMVIKIKSLEVVSAVKVTILIEVYRPLFKIVSIAIFLDFHLILKLVFMGVQGIKKITRGFFCLGGNVL